MYFMDLSKVILLIFFIKIYQHWNLSVSDSLFIKFPTCLEGAYVPETKMSNFDAKKNYLALF